MAQSTRLLASLALLGPALLAVSLVQAQEGTPAAPVASRVEPPLQLVLEAGGREHPITLDQPLELEAGGKLSVVLRCRPWRELVLPSLTLRYPREYHFEFKEDGGLATWTLSGADTKLLLFHTSVAGRDSAAVARQYADAMKAGLGPTAREEKAPQLVLGREELPGVRLRATLTGKGTAIVQDCHAWATNSVGCTVLVLQHSAEDDGSEPAESVALRRQLVESLRWR